MDLGKFIWMLQQRALFFARADKLGDAYEGYYTELSAIIGEQEHMAQTQEMARMLGLNFDIHQEKEVFKKLLRVIVEKRTKYFVNCWHINEEDSTAMWKLYGSQKESISITSTYQKLCDALPNEAFIGEVHYINYKRDVIEKSVPSGYGAAHAALPLKLIMHKRESYAHEREIRAVLWSEQPETSAKYTEENYGLAVPIDLASVIDAVYIGPAASRMLKKVVDGLLQKYECTRIRECQQSEVNAPPGF
jgi:hypothetical protein